jgi:ATP-dependent DNA helicase RecG
LIAEFERINKEFSDYKTAMIYGRMKPSEKQKIMRDFSDGKIDIL